MSDADALLLAILTDPADDLPRLMYADCLEDHGEPERAEFVRVQCELAGTPALSETRRDALRRRERELLGWFVAEDLAVELGLPPHESLYATDWGWICPGLGVELIPRRGFVAEVFLPLATFAGGPCLWCRGRGREWYADATGDMGDRECDACGGMFGKIRGTGRTPGVAPALFARHPVERVTLTDREPAPEAAADYLSDRLVAWGRGLAGLPPLPATALRPHG